MMPDRQESRLVKVKRELTSLQHEFQQRRADGRPMPRSVARAYEQAIWRRRRLLDRPA